MTYTAEPVLLLPWLMKKFITLGGKMERRTVQTLRELAEEGYDLIINCSGLGARELVADKTMTPVRGQIYKVHGRFPVATSFIYIHIPRECIISLPIYSITQLFFTNIRSFIHLDARLPINRAKHTIQKICLR